MGEFFHSVGDSHDRLVQPHHSRQVDRGRDHDHVARGTVDGLLQFTPLGDVVAHRRQEIEVRILLKRPPNRTDRERSRVYPVRRATLPRCDYSGAVRHFTVGERRSIFDHQYRFFHHSGVLTETRHAASTILAVGFAYVCCAQRSIDARRIHLVDDDYIRAPKIYFAGEVTKFVPGTMRVGDYDFEVRFVERRVIVAAVPQNDVAFFLGTTQDRS